MSFRPFKELKNWLMALFRKNELHDEFDAEMEQHLEFIIEEFKKDGMSADEARKAALKKFGNVESLKEDCQASWGVRVWDDLVQDTKYAFRQITKHKVHTAIIVLTLAVCMGSNTTAYNFVVKLVSKPYDYVDEEHIVLVGKKQTKLSGNSVGNISIPHWKFMEEHCLSFSEMGFQDDEIDFDLDLGGRVRRISTDLVTSGVWRATGIQPVVGRFFNKSDVEQTQGKVIVLSEKLWRDLGGQETDLIGQDLVLDNESYEIIGVAPRSFYMNMTRVDAYIPRIFMPYEIEPDQRNNHSHLIIAKLKPDVTLEQANQNLRAVFEAYMELHPGDREDQKRTGATFGAININRTIMQDLSQIEVAFKSIQWVTFVVLIIGCLNVGGMILVKGYSRIQELAMRKAMGASTIRLVRQIYVEIFAYFLLGGLCSLLILKGAYWGSRYLRFDEIPWAGDWPIDQASLLLTLVVSLGAALITGLMPLVSVLRRELMDFVKSGNRTMAGSISKHRLHAGFVISQVSLSVILLIIAGVLVLNLNVVLQKDVGFEKEGRIAFEIPQPAYRFDQSEEGYENEILPFQERVLERIRSMPGVLSASASSRVPISFENQGHSNFEMHHYDYAEGEPKANALRVITRPGYFKTVGTRLLLGRDFLDTDTFDSELVAIISQNAMERYYQGLNPVGMSIKFFRRDLKIIGVAEQVQDKPFFMEFDRYTLYLAFTQWYRMERGQTNYVAHVQGDPVQQIKYIEQAILKMDPKLAIKSVTFDDVYDKATFAQKLPMVVTVIFSSMALFLSGLGLYGLISFTVAERTKEYGIRMALGAGRDRILKSVLGGSGRLIGWGLIVGLVVSIVLCVKINPMFADVNTTNPITFITVIGFVVVICMLASFFPAHRATRINITETLQY